MGFRSALIVSFATALLAVGCQTPEQLVENGDAFTVSGNFAQADKAYKSALEAKPGMVPALIGMAKLSEVQGMEDAAEEWYRKAIDAKATNDKERKAQVQARDAIAKQHLARGEEHQLKKRNEQAIAEYDKGLQIKPQKALVDELEGRKDFILFQKFRDEVLLPRFDKIEEKMRKAGVKVYWVPETQIFVCEGSAPFDKKEWKGKGEDEYGPVLQKRAHDFVVKEMTRYAFAFAQVPQEALPDYKVTNFTVRGQQWVGNDYVIQVHFERDDLLSHAFRIDKALKEKKK